MEEDRARTSQQEVHCRVEEQAPVELEAVVGSRHCHEGQRVDRKRRNEQRAQCQRRWPQVKSTEDTRLWEEQGCLA